MPPLGPQTVMQTEHYTEMPCPGGMWGWDPACVLLANRCTDMELKMPRRKGTFLFNQSMIYASSDHMPGRKEKAIRIMKALNLFILTIRVYS